MPRSRKLLYGFAAVLVSVTATLATLLAVDLTLHRKFENAAGLNIWGYRGRPAGRKGPREIRVVVLGGSTVLGYGLSGDETLPYFLEKLLNLSATGPTTYSVVNLGYNQAGAYSFRYTLEDYAYLDYDIVILYEGYNDLGNPNRYLSRREWLAYRLTGYMPILPIVISEKIRLLREGDVRGAPPDATYVFRPGIVSRTKADALAASQAIGDAIERRFRSVKNAESEVTGPPTADECVARWTFYCRGVAAGVDYARLHHKPVFVVTQPYFAPLHREQQRELQNVLPRKYAADRDVHFVNLGDTVNLHDPDMCWDGMHLTPTGNKLIAEALAASVRASRN